MVVLVLTSSALALPHTKRSPLAYTGRSQPLAHQTSPGGRSRLVRRSSSLNHGVTFDTSLGIGDFTGQVGPGSSCGLRGRCGDSCCTIEDGGLIDTRCPPLQTYIAKAGGCVDCVIEPHPLCPRLSAGAFASALV